MSPITASRTLKYEIMYVLLYKTLYVDEETRRFMLTRKHAVQTLSIVPDYQLWSLWARQKAVFQIALLVPRDFLQWDF